MNTFVNALDETNNFALTTNGAVARTTTMNKVYDLFARGGSMRDATPSDCVLLFKKALEENSSLALKCLFYIRDCREGMGMRQFFRTCLRWLAVNYPKLVLLNLNLIPEYGRWDDLYALFDTPLEQDVLELIKTQLAIDIQDIEDGKNGISLAGKWLASENGSSSQTKRRGAKIRNYLHLTHREYRKMLSALRSTINIVEKLMSQNRWEEINFSTLPSRAGFLYRNAFARNELIGQKYKDFINNKQTKVHSGTLYPYEIAYQARITPCEPNSTPRLSINKFWENQPDYLNNKPCKILCVIDTSGSMTCHLDYNTNATFIDVAIGLGIYCAERIGGDFKNKFISFASHPQWIEIDGIDFVDKVRRIVRRCLVDSTNLQATFELVKQAMKESKPEDWPESIVVISDMQIIDAMTVDNITPKKISTDMERLRISWEKEGLKLPRLIYWNVRGSNPTFLDSGPDVSFVSGFSPILFQQILKGISGWELCLDKLLSERYAPIRG